jgi:hypothetical protein
MNTNTNINSNLLYEQDFSGYFIIIGCGLILGCSLYYLFSSNNTPIPTTNMEPLSSETIPTTNMEILTDEEIENYINESMETNSTEYIDNYITDSETDTESDNDTPFNSDSSSDIESIIDHRDLDLFYMPNVDFDVCSLHELKFFELSSLYAKEIAEKEVTEEDIMDFIESYTDEELLTNKINDLFALAVSLL